MNIHRNDPELNELKDWLEVPEPAWVRQKMEDLYANLPARQASHRRGAAPRRAKKLGRVFFIAAALACCFTLTALATSGELGRMAQGIIGFFHGGKDGGQPPATTLQPIADVLEANSLAVGQEKTENGLTVRVNEISVDHNFINVFATYTQDAPFALDENLPDTISPSYMHYFNFYVDGENVESAVWVSDECQGYLSAPNVYQAAYRLICDEPLPDTFTLELHSPRWYDENGQERGSLMGVDGIWDFAIPIDISNLSDKSIPAQEIDLGAGKLQLEDFRISALGAVARFGMPSTSFTQPVAEGTENPDKPAVPDAKETYTLPAEGYLWPDNVVLRDDRGNYLYAAPIGVYALDSLYVEYAGFAENTQSITFLPIIYPENMGEDFKTFPLQQGQRLEVSSLGGYTIESFQSDENGLSLTLKPYGPSPMPLTFALELFTCDGQGQQVDTGRGLMDTTIDRSSGFLTFSLRYYEPFDGYEQITQIGLYSVGQVTLDEAHAVTLPLQR